MLLKCILSLLVATCFIFVVTSSDDTDHRLIILGTPSAAQAHADFFEQLSVAQSCAAGAASQWESFLTLCYPDDQSQPRRESTDDRRTSSKKSHVSHVSLTPSTGLIRFTIAGAQSPSPHPALLSARADAIMAVGGLRRFAAWLRSEKGDPPQQQPRHKKNAAAGGPYKRAPATTPPHVQSACYIRDGLNGLYFGVCRAPMKGRYSLRVLEEYAGCVGYRYPLLDGFLGKWHKPMVRITA